MDRVDALARSYDVLEQLVRSVGPDDLGAPSPCEDWTAGEVLRHVLGAIGVFTRAVRDGEQLQPSPATEPLGDDPAGTLRAAADESIAAWRLPDAAERPTGMIPGVDLIDLLLADVVTHTWDLATAVGRPVDVDAEAVGYLAAKLEGGWAEAGQRMGAFGEPCDAGPDAPPLARMLALTGRDPNPLPAR